ncbi:MAG TPA: hypothetical protein VNX68_06815 [Nitrosopumilaceae archaeon]|nr:hypothetical protein [Nitrosopumilaceae archaeon]
MKFPIELCATIDGKAYRVNLLEDNTYKLTEITSDLENSLALRMIKVYNLWCEKGQGITRSPIKAQDKQLYDKVRLYFDHSCFWCCTYASEIKDLPVPMFTQDEIDWLITQDLIYQSFPENKHNYSLNGDKLRDWIKRQIKGALGE